MASPLPDEVVEEVLLRRTPDEPASLVRAALVCKSWCRLVSTPAFPRQFREFHRFPPMLGFVYRRAFTTHFMPTSCFRPPYADSPASWCAVDARHGRILYYTREATLFQPRLIHLVVSNPISGEERRLTTPRFPRAYCSWTAALPCAAPGCDHLDCPRGGPFAVVFVGTHESEERTSACLYSSEAGNWSRTTFAEHPPDRVTEGRSALVGNALYFIEEEGNVILEYDLGKQEL